MDGDMYKSTMDVFDSCYHKVVKGGRVIIDDYCISNCKNAVHKFREVNSFTEEITVIDQCGIFWIKN
jgi:Fe-S-cluster-containing dehydrogenase component